MDQLTIVYYDVSKHVDVGCVVDMVLFGLIKTFNVESHTTAAKNYHVLVVFLDLFLSGWPISLSVGSCLLK